MSDRVRTFSLVTLITALIWLVAESESLRTETLTFDVTVQSSGNKAVRLSPDQAWNRRVEVTVRGPTSAIDQLRQTVSPGRGSLPFRQLSSGGHCSSSACSPSSVPSA